MWIPPSWKRVSISCSIFRCCWSLADPMASTEIVLTLLSWNIPDLARKVFIVHLSANGTKWQVRKYRTLRWRHNGCDSVSNHQPHHCLLNRLCRRKSKKTSKLRGTGLCVGNSPVNSPHKWPVTRKMFPFDDVIMNCIETIQGFPLLHILFVLRKHWWWCLLWDSGHVYRKSFVPEIMVDGAHLMIWCNFNSGMVITVSTCPVKCGVKLLIHSQTLTAQPTQQSNFISHCIMGVITFPCRDYS